MAYINFLGELKFKIKMYCISDNIHDYNNIGSTLVPNKNTSYKDIILLEMD